VTYCTTAELVNLTGSALSSAILTAIIEQGDREIDAYLAPSGIGGAASGACKSASLELAKAGLLDYGRQAGTRSDQSTEGDYSETVQIEQAIARHRKTALALLDAYVAASDSTGTKQYYLRKVN
jgi:hypothetical protein